MCGRFHLATPVEVIAALFGVKRVSAGGLGLPRYNIAPQQIVAAVRASGPEAPGERELVPLRWGFVPYWADDPKVGNQMINARSESAATSPAFKNALRQRRCLIPADGFFEWKPIPGRAKQPVSIRTTDGKPLALAGLWERWTPRAPEGPGQETATILTCAPNALLEPIHDRMPVVLEPQEWAKWLDPAVTEPEDVRAMLDAFPAERMTLVEVGSRVNSVRNDDPACIEPLVEGKAEEGMLF